MQFLKIIVGVCAVFWAVAASAADLSKISKQEGFVSIEDALNANKDKPFECADYVAASHSCLAVSSSRIDGDTLVSANKILINEEPRVEVQISARLDLLHGLACGTASTWDIAVVGDSVTDELEKLVIDAVRSSVEKYGKVCVGYIRSNDVLQAINFSAQTGERIDEIPATNTTFWKSAPSLRVSEQT